MGSDFSDDRLPEVVQEDRAGEFLLDLSKEKSTADQNPALVYLGSLASSGRRGVESQLRKVAALFGCDTVAAAPWTELRYQHVERIRSILVESGAAPATANLTLAGIRGILNAAFNLGLYSSEDLMRIKNIKPVRGSRLPPGRALAKGELTALLEICDDQTPAGFRDAAIISLTYGAGMRRKEVAAAELADVSLAERKIRIIGKGNKERKVPLPSGTVAAVKDWIVWRGSSPGPLFHRILKGGRILKDSGLTDQGIYDILQRRRLQAKVEKCSPHDLRRSYISDLLDKKGDLALVQGLVGHSDPRTTSKYDRRGEEKQREAVDLLHVPYRTRRE